MEWEREWLRMNVIFVAMKIIQTIIDQTLIYVVHVMLRNKM